MFPINTLIAKALKVKRKRKGGGTGAEALGACQAPTIEKEVLRQLKVAVLGESGSQGTPHDAQEQMHRVLDELRRQLFLELGSTSGIARLKALQLLDVLFRHSAVFRVMACSELRTLVGCAQVSGSRGLLFHGAECAPPKDRQGEVRAVSLRLLEMWYV